MHRFLEAFFSPHAFRQVFPDVWNGFQTNIRMMVLAELLVLAFALAVAVIRGMGAPSLGLSYPRASRSALLPQAVRRVIPPLLNDFVGLQKDTAIISVAGVTEATVQAQNFGSSYFNYTGYVVAGVLFIFLTIPLARFTDHF